MIAITGANGQLGQKVVLELINKVAPKNIVALVRHPKKAQALKALGVNVRKADYNQPDTLLPALAGVQKLLLISGSEIGKRVEQHKAVIDAAISVGVSLLAYTSILRADTSPLLLAQEHKATESYIRETNIPAVILRNGWYSENYTDAVNSVLSMGAVAGAAKSGALHTAAREDYAQAAVAVLTSDQPQAGKVYELAGDQGFTLAQYAEMVSDITAKPIGYIEMEADDFQKALLNAGLPDGLAAALADTEQYAAQGWLADSSKTLSGLIGRPTTPLVETLKRALVKSQTSKGV